MCKCSISSLTKVDDTTYQTFCPIHGSREIYIGDHHEIETGKVRMARLRRKHTCSMCGEIFEDFTDTGQERNRCNRCAWKLNDYEEPEVKMARRETAKENSLKSSWRIGTRQNNSR